MKICAIKSKLPPITKLKAHEILHKIKPLVSDLYNITAEHFLNAGPLGLEHFHLVLNALIDDVNNIAI